MLLLYRELSFFLEALSYYLVPLRALCGLDLIEEISSFLVVVVYSVLFSSISSRTSFIGKTSLNFYYEVLLNTIFSTFSTLSCYKGTGYYVGDGFLSGVEDLNLGEFSPKLELN